MFGEFLAVAKRGVERHPGAVGRCFRQKALEPAPAHVEPPRRLVHIERDRGRGDKGEIAVAHPSPFARPHTLLKSGEVVMALSFVSCAELD